MAISIPFKVCAGNQHRCFQVAPGYPWHWDQHSVPQNTLGSRGLYRFVTLSHLPLLQVLTSANNQLPAEIGETLLSCPVEQGKSFDPVYSMPTCTMRGTTYWSIQKQTWEMALYCIQSQQQPSASLFNYLDHILGRIQGDETNCANLCKFTFLSSRVFSWHCLFPTSCQVSS